VSRAEAVELEFVDSVPPTMRPATLYVSIPFRTALHLCMCGCGREVVTPLAPAPRGWSLTYDGATGTLSPSVGSQALPCRSHYFIVDSRVDWLPAYAPDRVETVHRPSWMARLKAVARRLAKRIRWRHGPH
jgi:hypothetical protein